MSGAEIESVLLLLYLTDFIFTVFAVDEELLLPIISSNLNDSELT